MEAKLIYRTYKECVFNAKLIFEYYEKYNNCITIDSLDKEMHDVFGKIGLAYAKFMMLVSKRLKLENPSELLVAMMSYAHNEQALERKSVCLQQIAEFMDRNELVILRILQATLDLDCIDHDLKSLESSLSRANILIDRMEMLLKRSQNIYHQTLRISA